MSTIHRHIRRGPRPPPAARTTRRAPKTQPRVVGGGPRRPVVWGFWGCPRVQGCRGCVGALVLGWRRPSRLPGGWPGNPARRAGLRVSAPQAPRPPGRGAGVVLRGWSFGFVGRGGASFGRASCRCRRAGGRCIARFRRARVPGWRHIHVCRAGRGDLAPVGVVFRWGGRLTATSSGLGQPRGFAPLRPRVGRRVRWWAGRGATPGLPHERRLQLDLAGWPTGRPEVTPGGSPTPRGSPTEGGPKGGTCATHATGRPGTAPPGEVPTIGPEAHRRQAVTPNHRSTTTTHLHGMGRLRRDPGPGTTRRGRQRGNPRASPRRTPRATPRHHRPNHPSRPPPTQAVRGGPHPSGRPVNQQRSERARNPRFTQRPPHRVTPTHRAGTDTQRGQRDPPARHETSGTRDTPGWR
ncbi:hypothetical protein E143388_07782 [Rhodococcus opacus]|nr:hypothetical protein E143388_07782 [Rhodococcus opacus]